MGNCKTSKTGDFFDVERTWKTSMPKSSFEVEVAYFDGTECCLRFSSLQMQLQVLEDIQLIRERVERQRHEDDVMTRSSKKAT